MSAKQKIKSAFKKRKIRITAGIVAIVFLLSNILPLSTVVFAAQPTVSVDEAAYVNLDYYGNVSKIDIVKGVSLNGLTQFKDYGKYESVSNMSSDDKPAIETDGVSWDLKNYDVGKRFYYECKVNADALILPWTVDVSYKLNGVPCKAENLAGKDGVIEINVHVIPNPKARAYYKNNMLLQVVTYVNMEDTYSLDAPGSQLQSAGTYKAVVFAALPGEEDTYTIRIGTKSFETKGITITMLPGTLKELKDIKEIKDAKDTLYDSYNTIYSSMNDVLNSIDSMKTGLSELQSGTAALDEARSTFSDGKEQMNEYADQSLKDMTAANQQLKKIIPYFETAQNMVKDMKTDINKINSSLNDIGYTVGDTADTVKDIRENLDTLDGMLDAMDTQIKTALTTLGTVAAAGGATQWEQAELQGWAKMATVLGNYAQNISALSKSMQSLASTAEDVADYTEKLTERVNNLNNTLNSYNGDTLNLLNDSQKLTTLLSSSIDSTITYLTYAKTLMQTFTDQLDDATKTSLNGMNDLLGEGISGLGSIPSMRNANNKIKSTVDKEIKKFDKENQFLNLDADAKLVSFTSDNNPTPSSIQVIMRTNEISIADKNSNNSDLETDKVNIGIIGRIKNLFFKILGVFHIAC